MEEPTSADKELQTSYDAIRSEIIVPETEF